MARRTLLIIASILLAALGTALIWLYVQGAENRARQSAELVRVYVFTSPASAGTPATALPLAPQAVPKALAATAVTSPSELGTQKLTIGAAPGQLLLKSMLGTSATDTTRFPAGGAVAVTINDPNRVPADLQPGDSVDIFALGKDGASVVLSDITVRTVGPAHAKAPGTTTANGSAQNGGIPPSIVGLDIKDAKTAAKLYGIVARGGQMALYLHNPRTP